MSILIVGNVLKDVYLNIDDRTEPLELDKNGISWLDLSFDSKEHHFFNRESNLGGAAVSLEVLQKMGLDATISDSNLKFSENGLTPDDSAATHRYILVSNGGVSYLSPSKFKKTDFIPPAASVDYLFLDRSANLDLQTAKKLHAYLDLSPNTKLVLYLRNLENSNTNGFISRANLVFLENNRDISEFSYAPALQTLDPKKLIHLSENNFSYLGITRPISVDRIDFLTHLSVYSIAAATILGSFVLGNSVEDSLDMAKLNVENSKLNSVLSLKELQDLAASLTPNENLELIAASLVLSPKGILAADESGGSIKKKFAQLNIPDTYEFRRDYRNIFFTTPDLEKYVNGVILFDETARQAADNGQNFVDFLTSRRIIPGIKVDEGLEPFNPPTIEDPSLNESYTKGLLNLSARLREYYIMGLRFAKWRAAFHIHFSDQGDLITPTDFAIEENCRILAEYARECQSAGLVPIVEPEVVYDGNYTITQNATITAHILDVLFQKLNEYGVNLRACLLKVNMILAGKQSNSQSTPIEVGEATAKVLKEHVPEELAGIVFLSGGQTPEQATANLAEVAKNGPFPWPVTFSFARALQDPALHAWAGDNTHADTAREAFQARLIANSKALEERTSSSP